MAGDPTDDASMRSALSSVRTLLPLNAVTPDEVTQALVTLDLAREAGIARIVCLSVIHADRHANMPHFTGKHAVERMIEDLDAQAWTGAATWSTGSDLAAFEAQPASFGPARLAYDVRLMMGRIREIGMHGQPGAVDRLQAILGRPLRTHVELVSGLGTA